MVCLRIGHVLTAKFSVLGRIGLKTIGHVATGKFSVLGRIGLKGEFCIGYVLTATFGTFGRIVLKSEQMLGEISLLIMSMLLLAHRSVLFVQDLRGATLPAAFCRGPSPQGF